MTVQAPYSLLKELGQYSDSDLPPVHKWHPEHISDIDMRIDRDGRWFHEGTLIKRQRLVRLFSTILRKEGNDFFLVTPVEKCVVAVEDAPFVAVLMEQIGAETGPAEQILRFTTNVGDYVVLDEDHPLRVQIEHQTGEPSPYIQVRDGLDALLSRNVYYQLAELMVERCHEGAQELGVWSSGQFHCMMKVKESE